MPLRQSSSMKKIDLTNRVFGRLTVLRDSGERRSKQIMWECQCVCGNVTYVHGSSLCRGLTQSCGCYHKDQTSLANRVDLTGQIFGRLTVLRPLDIRRGGEICWECQCKCGEMAIIRGYLLQTGATTSCGCFHREQTSKINFSHGKSTTRIYKIWTNIISRCYREHNINYDNYGGRGITVCDSWRNSFEAFYKDMGEPPSDRHSLDRIDNNGNYTPLNCRWADTYQQANNSRKNRILSANGVSHTMAEWSRILGISYNTIKSRISYGWGDERILTTPVQNQRKKNA